MNRSQNIRAHRFTTKHTKSTKWNQALVSASSVSSCKNRIEIICRIDPNQFLQEVTE